MKKISPETWRNYKFAGEEDGKNCTIYYLSDSDGSGKGIMHVYEVMPGILMSYDVLDMKSCWQDTPPVPGFIQTAHSSYLHIFLTANTEEFLL